MGSVSPGRSEPWQTGATTWPGSSSSVESLGESGEANDRLVEAERHAGAGARPNAEWQIGPLRRHAAAARQEALGYEMVGAMPERPLAMKQIRYDHQ